MADENEQQSDSWLDRVKESPRTVSALIIILIVAAAIYAFSGDTNEPGVVDNDTGGAPQQTDEATPSPADDTDEEAAATPTPAVGETTATTTPTTEPSQPVTRDQLNEQAQQLPEPTRNDEGFVEVAQAGEGVTHLARRATTRWLGENDAGYTLTNEHRIYIEDYIQNRLGTNGLSLGESQTVSYELIREAVAAAGQLNDTQLQNLSQYTYVLN